MEDIGCKTNQKPQKHSNVWKKRRLAFVLKQELPAGASEWMRDERGVGDPQNDFSDLLLIILRWPYRSSQLFITIFHHLETIWKIFWGQRTVLRALVEPPPNILLSTCWKLFWGGWVPFTKMILQGFSVFEHIILKHLPPTSTSDSLF